MDTNELMEAVPRHEVLLRKYFLFFNLIFFLFYLFIQIKLLLTTMTKCQVLLFRSESTKTWVAVCLEDLSI